MWFKEAADVVWIIFQKLVSLAANIAIKVMLHFLEY
jgi:hypothetical protein